MAVDRQKHELSLTACGVFSARYALWAWGNTAMKSFNRIWYTLDATQQQKNSFGLYLDAALRDVHESLLLQIF